MLLLPAKIGVRRRRSRRTRWASSGSPGAGSARALRFCRESAALLRDADLVGMLAFALAGLDAGGRPGGRVGGRARRGRRARTDAARAQGLRGRAGAGARLGGRRRRRALACAPPFAERGRPPLRRRAARTHMPLARCTSSAGSAVRPTAAPELARLAGRIDGPFAGDRGRARVGTRRGRRRGPARGSRALRRRPTRCSSRPRRRHAGGGGTPGRGQALERPGGGRPGRALADSVRRRAPADASSTAPDAVGLTPRERDRLAGCRRGEQPRIAGRLVLSVRTVDNHLQNAYRKLGVSRRQTWPASWTPRRGSRAGTSGRGGRVSAGPARPGPRARRPGG